MMTVSSTKADTAAIQAHLRHINPFPSNLGEVLRSYDRVVVPEMNLGQLAMLLRAKYLVDTVNVNQVRGLPFKSGELVDMIADVVSTLDQEGDA
jgi:2-oxoglutarate ferredoxin oxidoreductase subunit alpha